MLNLYTYAYYRKELGAPELLPAFLSISSLFSPLSVPSSSSQVLIPTDLVDLFTDLSVRFLDDGLEEIVGPILRLLCFHPSLQRPEGLGGGDTAWRSIVAALECLVGVKGVAMVITRLDDWCPENADPSQLEHTSLMGPLLRLGVFNREWVSNYIPSVRWVLWINRLIMESHKLLRRTFLIH